MKSTPVIIASQWNSFLIEYHPISKKLSINSWKCFKLQARLSNLNILRAVQWYLLRNMTEHTVCALTTVKLTSWQRRMSYIPATLDRWRVRRLGWGSVFFFASIWPPGTSRCKWKKRMGLHCKTAFSTHQGHLWPPPDQLSWESTSLRAGGCRFKPWSDQESAAYVMTSANGYIF